MPTTPFATKAEKTPLLFLGHGSPMNAIEENPFVEGFRQVANLFQKPKAIICISAHWYTKGSFVTHDEHPRTIHDFYGFPPPLYEVRYPAMGNPVLATQVKALLRPTEVNLDTSWGLDHGCWSVLKHLYPDASVPVIQLSLDRTKPAAEHYTMAKRLAHLREEGILLVGSGNLVHNLRLVDFNQLNNPGAAYPWAAEASAYIKQCLKERDFNSLINTHQQPAFMQLAVPTPDHYLPLMYLLGLWEDDEKLTLFNDELVGGSISMTSLLVH